MKQQLRTMINLILQKRLTKDKEVTSHDDSFDGFRLSLRLPVTTVDNFPG